MFRYRDRHPWNAEEAGVNLPRTVCLSLQDASEPLHKRAPVYDEDGTALSDFMVLFPGLRDKPAAMREAALREIHAVLCSFQHAVVFAEVNLKLNLLWVSIRPLSGVRLEIAGALQACLPEARLVSHI
jgi:hypothetical protein